ncbi:MAG TPA: ABC transporter permease subunit [Hyphomicrobiaceae bacterium]|jgi:glutamate/aspartate transport system permease protein|nr:ABC transporter permease subunit [Hyphomicrobiaceae bacterium]
MFTDFDFSVIFSNLPYLFFDGMRFTLMLTALATVGGVVLGTLIALMRLSGIPGVSHFAAGYTNLMRSLPFVLVIFWFYFLLPYVGQWVIGASRPIAVGAFMSALVTFTLFEAAYFSEIMRAGIQSIPRGQVSAGYALGLRYWQVMSYVILPQAFRNMLPVLLTQTIILFQDTSLVYVLSITDFLGAASKIAQRDGRLVEMYLFAAVVYFAISFALSQIVRQLQARTAIVR